MSFTNEEFRKIIFVKKNRSSNSYLKPTNFACEVESNLTIELEVEFQIKVDCEDFLNLNETF